METSLRPWALTHVFCLIFVVWQGALSCWEKQLFRWEAYGEGTSTRMARSKVSQQNIAESVFNVLADQCLLYFYSHNVSHCRNGTDGKDSQYEKAGILGAKHYKALV